MGGCAAEESELGKREWELNDCLREECLSVQEVLSSSNRMPNC